MGQNPLHDTPAAPAMTAHDPLSPSGREAEITDMGSQGTWSGSEPPPPDDDPLVGSELSGTYQVLRILGEGGMGRVYEAQHTRIGGKRYAIKALHPEFARRKDVLTRFQREVEAAASIESPFVVGVFDVGETSDGRPFFVSELLQGVELGDYLDQRSKVPVPWAANIVRQICRGLAAAHQRGVVHRDMKPENVFLTGDITAPTVKVLDFGISRLEGQNGNTLTKTGVVMGTPSYMAPEQAKGFRVDHRADVYAAGAILYRAVTGKLPFDRPDATATLAAVLTEDPAPPRSLAPELPQHLELIIQRAMAREPEDRYQDMAELEAALASYDQLEAAHPESTVKASRATQASITNAHRQAREVSDARPQLVTLGLASVVAGLAGLLSLVAGLVRVTRHGKPLTFFEALVVLAIIMAALTTPLILVVRHVRKTIWDNIARVMEMVAGLKRPLVVGMASYGAMALAVRTGESLIVRNPAGTSWAWWDFLLPLVAMLVAVATLVAQRAKPGTPSLIERAGPTAALAGSVGVALIAVFAAFGLRDGVPAAAGADEKSAKTDGDDAEDSSSDDDKDDNHEPAGKTKSDSKGNEDAFEAWKNVTDAMKQNDWEAVVAGVEKVLRMDPDAIDDPAVSKSLLAYTVRACINEGAACKGMMDLLSERAGTAGPDLLFELITTKGGTSAQKRADRLLADPSVMRGASEALRIAYELRKASGCGAVEKLYPEVEKKGDHRALRELKILQSRRQCRARGCCLNGQDPAVKRLERAILDRQ